MSGNSGQNGGPWHAIQQPVGQPAKNSVSAPAAAKRERLSLPKVSMGKVFVLGALGAAAWFYFQPPASDRFHLTRPGPFKVEATSVPLYSSKSMDANFEKTVLTLSEGHMACALDVNDDTVTLLNENLHVYYAKNNGLSNLSSIGPDATLGADVEKTCVRMIQAAHLNAPAEVRHPVAQPAHSEPPGRPRVEQSKARQHKPSPTS